MTITSKEVAEMLGKRHDNLLRAIRKYITQGIVEPHPLQGIVEPHPLQGIKEPHLLVILLVWRLHGGMRQELRAVRELILSSLIGNM